MPANQDSNDLQRAAGPCRLYVNIDHVATVRQARGGLAPDPVEAALQCERAGADGITAHLREDRRHIQDADIERLQREVRTVFNFEMAATPEMIAIALRLRPHQVTLVPERRDEVTTEGGLDVRRSHSRVGDAVRELATAGIRTALFIAPERDAVDASAECGAVAVELHTGSYAHGTADPRTLAALRDAAAHGRAMGLAVHAGHGLSLANVEPVAAIAEIEELNIGHAIVGHAIFVGLDEAVARMLDAMARGRGGLVDPPLWPA